MVHKKDIGVYLAVSISFFLLLYPVVFLFFSHQVLTLGIQNQMYQSFLFIVASLCVTVLLFFAQGFFVHVLLFVKLGFFVFICFSIGIRENIYQFIFTSLLFDVMFLNTYPLCLFYGFGLIFVFFLSLRDHTVLFELEKGLDFAALIYALLYGIAIIFIGSLYNWHKEKVKKQGVDIQRLEDIVNKVTKTNIAYQSHAISTEAKAIEKERNRISREMHDIIGYTLTNVLMSMQAAIHTQFIEDKNMILVNAVEHVNASLEDARLSLRRLRDWDVKTERGANSFIQLCKNFSLLTEIDIDIEFVSFPREISPDIEKVLFRMIQESLTNAFKHGKATRIQVTFQYKNKVIFLRIHDNGLGAQKIGENILEGIGLMGMRERLLSLGGFLSALYVVDGFLVQAVIPFEEEDELNE